MKPRLSSRRAAASSSSRRTRTTASSFSDSTGRTHGIALRTSPPRKANNSAVSSGAGAPPSPPANSARISQPRAEAGTAAGSASKRVRVRGCSASEARLRPGGVVSGRVSVTFSPSPATASGRPKSTSSPASAKRSGAASGAGVASVSDRNARGSKVSCGDGRRDESPARVRVCETRRT